MATVDMTQQPGGSTIRSDVGPGGTGGAFGDLMSQIVARRMQQAEEDRQRKLALEQEAAGDRATARRRDEVEYNQAAAARRAPQKVAINRADNSGIRRPSIGGESYGIGQQVQAARGAAELEELDSASRGPVQRYVTAGPGIVGGGLTNDVSRMNAYQRKQYLPAGAGLAAGPAEHNLGEEADESETLAMRRLARQRAMQGAPQETVRGLSSDAVGGAGRQARVAPSRYA